MTWWGKGKGKKARWVEEDQTLQRGWWSDVKEKEQPPEQLHYSSEPWANSDEELNGRIDSCHVRLVFFMPQSMR